LTRPSFVTGLQIPVDDALRMRGGQSVRDLPAVVDRLAGWQGAGRQPLAQRLTFEQLRDDVRRMVVGRADVVNREDVGMIEHAGRAGFLLETAQAIGVCRKPNGQDLDGNVAPESRIARFVDFAHAEGGLDFVRTETRAGRQGHALPFTAGWRSL
jgi:hypothetical protein